MVDQEMFDSYLKGRYAGQVEWYDKKSLHSQRWSRRYHVAIATLSALTPALAGLSCRGPTIISSILLSSAVGILKYCKFEEHWHNYRTTCETLKKEKTLFDARISPYDKADDPTKLFMERTEWLISEENTAWIQIVSKKKKD